LIFLDILDNERITGKYDFRRKRIENILDEQTENYLLDDINSKNCFVNSMGRCTVGYIMIHIRRQRLSNHPIDIFFLTNSLQYMNFICLYFDYGYGLLFEDKLATYLYELNVLKNIISLRLSTNKNMDKNIMEMKGKTKELINQKIGEYIFYVKKLYKKKYPIGYGKFKKYMNVSGVIAVSQKIYNSQYISVFLFSYLNHHFTLQIFCL